MSTISSLDTQLGLWNLTEEESHAATELGRSEASETPVIFSAYPGDDPGTSTLEVLRHAVAGGLALRRASLHRGEEVPSGTGIDDEALAWGEAAQAFAAAMRICRRQVLRCEADLVEWV